VRLSLPPVRRGDVLAIRVEAKLSLSVPFDHDHTNHGRSRSSGLSTIPVGACATRYH